MPITFSNCSFGYRRGHLILDDLNLTFGNGVSVLLGPNGAGKSTLLQIASTALRPTTGRVVLDGLDARNRKALREFRRKVGWLPQQVKATPGLRVREQAAYAGWLKGMTRSSAWDESAKALSRVSLSDLADRRSSELSGGQLRRLGIASALVHRADVVLMDEPTAGLDPAQRSVFRDLISELGSTTSFVVSTHQTEDLAHFCDDIVLLERGQVRYQGSLAEFFSRAPEGTAPERLAEAAYAGFVTAEV